MIRKLADRWLVQSLARVQEGSGQRSLCASGILPFHRFTVGLAGGAPPETLRLTGRKNKHEHWTWRRSVVFTTAEFGPMSACASVTVCQCVTRRRPGAFGCLLILVAAATVSAGQQGPTSNLSEGPPGPGPGL